MLHGSYLFHDYLLLRIESSHLRVGVRLLFLELGDKNGYILDLPQLHLQSFTLSFFQPDMLLNFSFFFFKQSSLHCYLSCLASFLVDEILVRINSVIKRLFFAFFLEFFDLCFEQLLLKVEFLFFFVNIDEVFSLCFYQHIFLFCLKIEEFLFGCSPLFFQFYSQVFALSNLFQKTSVLFVNICCILSGTKVTFIEILFLGELKPYRLGLENLLISLPFDRLANYWLSVLMSAYLELMQNLSLWRLQPASDSRVIPQFSQSFPFPSISSYLTIIPNDKGLKEFFGIIDHVSGLGSLSETIKTLLSRLQKRMHNIIITSMGNCQDQFQNIKEDASSLSERNRIDTTTICKLHHSARPDTHQQQYMQQVFDHELIHSTVIHQQQSPLAIQASFHEKRPVGDSQSVERLEELDFQFYHHLALSDYVFRPTPNGPQFDNLETAEKKDEHGIKYIGEWKDGLIHGNGVLISNTSKYIGQFRYGLKHFHGRQIFKEEVYEGEFQSGRRRGIGVKYTKQSTEEGLFNGDLIYGSIVYTNGDYYFGTLKGNKYHGIGLDFSRLGQKNQQQQFQQWSLSKNCMDSYHEIFNKDDNFNYDRLVKWTQMYQQQQSQNIKNSWFLANKARLARQLEGESSQIALDNKEKLIQAHSLQWKQTVQQNNNIAIANLFYQASTGTRYECANFSQCSISWARAIYSNGNAYEGDLVKRCKHGKGTFLWKDGSSYEGEYFWDQKHGTGTLKMGGKQYKDKIFVNGILQQDIQSQNQEQGSQLPSQWL